jgi:hypothetical protein
MAHPLVVHVMRDKYDIYCGRWNPKVPINSIWANPFKDGTREENIQRYIDYLAERPDLLRQVHTLKGKVLACWCAPLDCHLDVLAMLANDV